MSDCQPTVSFIVATYKRADALRCTLNSLILQVEQNWEAVVVGDCCGEETADVIRSLNDKRLRYYNLPERWGEQSGPNNFGLHIAKGRWIAFLNHDDMLLRDHLTYALERLSNNHSNFFIGQFANITRLEQNDAGQCVPVATKRLPQTTDLSVLVQRNPYLLDPSSFWLIDAAFARKVGHWRPARALWRTPLRDWLMRAWRLRARFCFGERITGVRFWTQNLRRDGPLYSHATPEHEWMLEQLRSRAGDDLREMFQRQIDNWRDDATFDVQLMAWPKRKFLAMIYRVFGYDFEAMRSRRAGKPLAATMNKIALKRTGAQLPPLWDMSRVLADPESCRVL